MKTGRGAFNREFASRVLADATVLGSDTRAAEKHGISRKTVERYRRRMSEGDGELSSLVSKKVEVAEQSWHRVRNRGLTALVERMVSLAANEADMDKVTRAVSALGELDIAGGVLGVGAGNRPEGSGPSESEGGPASEEDGAGHDDNGDGG